MYVVVFFVITKSHERTLTPRLLNLELERIFVLVIGRQIHFDWNFSYLVIWIQNEKNTSNWRIFWWVPSLWFCSQIDAQECMSSASRASKEPLVGWGNAHSSSFARHKCPFCPMMMGDTQRLKKHISLKHSKYTSFNCSFCSYVGCSRSAIQIHTRKHTGERPFSCPAMLCVYKAASKSNLIRHMKAKHSFTILNDEHNWYGSSFYESFSLNFFQFL